MKLKNEFLVTIGIPTFNRANGFLNESIESAINQTYSNIEIIVADNCSTDGTYELVGSLKDPRIRYFKHDSNIGANNNFNFCLDRAKGDFFLLLHDDDLIDKDFVETCMEALNKNREAGLVRTGTRLIDAKGKTIKEKLNRVEGESLEDFCLEWFKGKTSLYLCSTIFNTKKLKEIGGFESKTNLFQDVVAQVILTKKYGKIDIRETKASFRKHSGELTFSKKVTEWCEDSLYLLDIICRLSESKKEEIRSEGMKFFSKINYNRASSINSFFEKLVTYANVYKKFDYSYNPALHIYSKKSGNGNFEE